MRNFKQGLYVPKHPEKYIGNLNKIRYMSSWELKFHSFLDNNISILEWASEPFPIPYIHPIDQKIHRYFPDYYIKYADKQGTVIREIIEIKPKSQTSFKKRKMNINERIVVEINHTKWKFAEEFCKKNGFVFRILTEEHLYGNKR